MNETSFSRWLCQHLIKQGLFPQRLEVTTGAGVPDIAVLGASKTISEQMKPTEAHSWGGSGTRRYCNQEIGTAWLELKWNTNHIRPEQFVWGTRAKSVGVDVNYIVGSDDIIQLYSLDGAKKMTKSFKLTKLLMQLPRHRDSIPKLVEMLR